MKSLEQVKEGLRTASWRLVTLAAAIAIFVSPVGCGAPQGAAESSPQVDTEKESKSKPNRPQPKKLVDHPPGAFPSLEIGLEYMMKAAKEKNSAEMMAIGKWVGRNHTPAAIVPLENVVLDENAPVESKLAACYALRCVGPAGGASLIKAVDAKSSPVAANAVKSLVAIRPVVPRLVEHLTGWIDHSDLQVQRAAIQSLSLIGKKAESSAPKLLAIVRDPASNPTLRGEAERALKSVNPRRTFQD